MWYGPRSGHPGLQPLPGLQRCRLAGRRGLPALRPPARRPDRPYYGAAARRPGRWLARRATDDAAAPDPALLRPRVHPSAPAATDGPRAATRPAPAAAVARRPA